MHAKSWKPVRLTSETCELIDRVKAILLRGHEMGRRSVRFDSKMQLPNDEAIRILAEHFLAHNERSRKSASSPATTDQPAQ